MEEDADGLQRMEAGMDKDVRTAPDEDVWPDPIPTDPAPGNGSANRLRQALPGVAPIPHLSIHG